MNKLCSYIVKTNGLRFKVNILGSSRVGKTSFARKLTLSDSEPILTIGATILKKKFQMNDKEIQFMIYDTARYERFNFVNTKFLYPKSNGGIFIFDITNKSSLSDINTWITNFRNASEGKKNDIPILLLGNKIDLEDKREVTQKHGLELVEKYDLFDFLEISAKTGENVENAFVILAREIILRNKLSD